MFDIFSDHFINVHEPLKIIDFHFNHEEDEQIEAYVTVEFDGITKTLVAKGNGRIDSISNALKNFLHISFTNLTYVEHALEKGSDSKAVCYVSITADDGQTEWGVGVHNDIVVASVRALAGAVNHQICRK